MPTVVGRVKIFPKKVRFAGAQPLRFICQSRSCDATPTMLPWVMQGVVHLWPHFLRRNQGCFGSVPDEVRFGAGLSSKPGAPTPYLAS